MSGCKNRSDSAESSRVRAGYGSEVMARSDEIRKIQCGRFTIVLN